MPVTRAIMYAPPGIGPDTAPPAGALNNEVTRALLNVELSVPRVKAGLVCKEVPSDLAILSSESAKLACAVNDAALAFKAIACCDAIQSSNACDRTVSSGLTFGGVTPSTLRA